MIILGRKYKFTTLELIRLQKHFPNIQIVPYTHRESLDVINEIKAHINKYGIGMIILNTQQKVSDDLIKFLTQLQFNNVESIPTMITIEHFLEKFLNKCYIPECNNELHFLEEIQPYTKWQYLQKRFIDYTSIIVLLLLTWPLLIYSNYKIKKESPGTSIYKQSRVGLRNQEFICLKFRSMRLDAEQDGAKFATIQDKRIFSYGVLMRKMRIDELPQLLNVLKGEMHLIGPRPERKVWTDKFEQDIPYYAERHIVKPGITGWAQVMYPYGNGAEDARQKLMYDLYYIKHWSIFFEIKIVIKTIRVILQRKGL